jgi:hypothetical protein
MVMKVKIGQRLTCRRCGKQWHVRQTVVRICPTCKTKHWNTPRDAKKATAA